MSKTIAEQLNIKEFLFIIKDKNGNKTYSEDSNKFWYRKEYDSNGNVTYSENSNKYWSRREYDSNGNETYFEDSNGMTWETPKASIIELTLEDIAKLKGVPVNQIRIKD